MYVCVCRVDSVNVHVHVSNSSGNAHVSGSCCNGQQGNEHVSSE